jgi:hypothetical protein
VTVLPGTSWLWNTNGPAEVTVPVTQPLLNVWASLLTDAGNSGLNSPRQSAYGWLNVTSTSRVSLPGVTAVISL